MRPIVYGVASLTETLQRKTVATLDELSVALGGCSPATVHRKLKQLDYLSSYSHRGRYYALRASAGFDADGLWFHEGIRFSSRGTLRATAKKLVEASALGYRSAELDGVLKVHTLNALAALVRAGDLARGRFEGRSVYCAADDAKRQRQIAARRIQRAGTEAMPVVPDPTQADASRSAAIALFYGVLNEKQRRLYAGLNSLLWGHGGDRRTAKLLGLSRKTVRKGRLELASGEVDLSRIRRPGGGRTPLLKKTRG